MIDFRREAEVETRAALERCSPGASRRARDWASRSRCQSATAPNGRARRSTPGASIEDIYRDAVAETKRTYAGAAETAAERA